MHSIESLMKKVKYNYCTKYKLYIQLDKQIQFNYIQNKYTICIEKRITKTNEIKNIKKNDTIKLHCKKKYNFIDASNVKGI